VIISNINIYSCNKLSFDKTILLGLSRWVRFFLILHWTNSHLLFRCFKLHWSNSLTWFFSTWWLYYFCMFIYSLLETISFWLKFRPWFTFCWVHWFYCGWAKACRWKVTWLLSSAFDFILSHRKGAIALAEVCL
jgi:hypothetical protein